MKMLIVSRLAGTICFEVMNRQVLDMLMIQYMAYNPVRVDDDAIMNTGRLLVEVQVNDQDVPAVSEYDLLWLERHAFSEGSFIAYSKRRVVKKLRQITFLEDEILLSSDELTQNPSFRIALSARCALWPDVDVHCIHDNYFIRIVGDYWAIVGNQTVWDTSDEIRI